MDSQPSNSRSATARGQEGALLEAYVGSLSDKEKKAYLIASSHLGSSFSLEKSNGFLKWKTSRAAAAAARADTPTL
jgi:hypothetical protein